MSDLKQTFWDRMEDTRTGMLSTDGAPAVPMSHNIDAAAGVLWFITAKGTDLSKAAQGTSVASDYIVSSDSAKIYARLHGTLSAVTDPAQLDDVWNAFAAAWFEDGEKDDDVQLLRLDLTEGEVWAPGGGLSFLYEIAKANLTDSIPDAGAHGTLKF